MFKAVLADLLLATIFVVASASISIAVLRASVPRRQEGVRDVPVVSWTPYAGAAFAVPATLTIACVCLIYTGWKRRIVISLAALTIWSLLYGFVVWDLLLRDFKGKL